MPFAATTRYGEGTVCLSPRLRGEAVLQGRGNADGPVTIDELIAGASSVPRAGTGEEETDDAC